MTSDWKWCGKAKGKPETQELFRLSRLVFYLSPVLLHFYDVRAWVYFQVSGQVSNLVTPRSQPSQLAPVTSLGRSVGCRLRPKKCLDFINGLGDGETLYFASPGHLLSDKLLTLPKSGSSAI